MKILLYIPTIYSLKDTIKKGFNNLGHEMYSYDFRDDMSKWQNKIVRKTSGLHYDFKRYFYDIYIEKANNNHLSEAKKIQPDLIIIYNNELFLPKTIIELKKIAKVAFFLGDSPLFLTDHSYKYAISIIKESDLVISPDTGWNEQLEMLGIENTMFGIWGYDDGIFKPLTIDDKTYKKYKSDLIYIGSCSPTSWGYKLMDYLSRFAQMDIKIYATGRGWDKWIDFFPELKSKIRPYNTHDQKMTNILSNYAKIYPVEEHPSLINAFNMRVLDCIGSGILPIVEYRRDVEKVFDSVFIPTIKNYNDAREIAQYYLDNDKARFEIIENLRMHILKTYQPKHLAEKIVNTLFISS